MTTKSILIVDDDSAIGKYLSYTLNSANYKVELATDGYEALTQARNSRYDLAIVDLVLPGEMNGMDIINSLKTISPDTRVIATSAYSGQAFGDKTTQAGADMFITKTLLSEQLLPSVESLLGKPTTDTNEYIIPASTPVEPALRPEELIIPEGPPESQKIREGHTATDNSSSDTEIKMEEFMPDKVIIPSNEPEKSDNEFDSIAAQKSSEQFSVAGSPPFSEEPGNRESAPEKLAVKSEFIRGEEQSFANSTSAAPKANNKPLTPHILKKLPKDAITNILTLGRLIKVEAGKKVIVNYTGEVVIVNKGRANCKYGNKTILTLDEGDAVGEECLLLEYDPQFKIIIEAEQALQLIIIPKDVLNDYFKKQDVSLFIGFQLNVTLSLSKKLRQSFTQIDRH